MRSKAILADPHRLEEVLNRVFFKRPSCGVGKNVVDNGGIVRAVLERLLLRNMGCLFQKPCDMCIALKPLLAETPFVILLIQPGAEGEGIFDRPGIDAVDQLRPVDSREST